MIPEDSSESRVRSYEVLEVKVWSLKVKLKNWA